MGRGAAQRKTSKGLASGEARLLRGGQMALWMRRCPTVGAAQVQAQFEVSRATAYRMLAAAQAAQGFAVGDPAPKRVAKPVPAPVRSLASVEAVADAQIACKRAASATPSGLCPGVPAPAYAAVHWPRGLL